MCDTPEIELQGANRVKDHMDRSAKTMIAIALGSAILAGCGQRPVVAQKWPGFEEKADAIRDWQVVAHQIAIDMIRRSLLPDPYSRTANAPLAPSRPYYISVAIPSSKFLHEVRQSLQSEILWVGGAVASSEAGAIPIKLDADVVYWPSAVALHDGAPATEVAWEASITWGDRVIFDVRYPMYVSEVDVPHYAAAPVGPPPVRLSYTP
jgi:hypothetical protein